MAKLSPDAVVDLFKDMTLAEVTEFRQRFEETFGVTATTTPAPIVVPDEAIEAEEQIEFDVFLDAVGERKIEAIKVVRALGLGLGLKEAKDLVDSAPARLMSEVTQHAAEEAKAKLEAVGATVSVR